MTPSTKKLILILSFPVFLVLYIGIVLAIADRLPDHWAIDLVYYILVGTVWAFPLKPVLLWANRPVPDPERS
ncbi:hypothetical protein PB2503_12814 [Parvularcula bermudensis HTCC2503]|uniref:DUF2842 domain-containing protein n=1 Tax=Parvularcula bermudensis (strain ATCC BAA-594 / HTCC2503 / KCTC 12087) TaxID=314260 RepID=E0TG29_PARBH|nr:DUF2842 domain-containing protein [Parvularcula bermudensis]ADM10600.1 hypothetical protein PB2503_12814 [Parvularcula bermudensis HTCC2503]